MTAKDSIDQLSNLIGGNCSLPTSISMADYMSINGHDRLIDAIIDGGLPLVLDASPSILVPLQSSIENISPESTQSFYGLKGNERQEHEREKR